MDRRIQSKPHHFQLNCYRILQETFSYLNAYPDSDEVQLKLLVNNQKVIISLDGFLTLKAIQGEDGDLGNGLNAVLESRLALYSGEFQASFRKKRLLMTIKLYCDPYDNSPIGGRSSHCQERH